MEMNDRAHPYWDIKTAIKKNEEPRERVFKVDFVHVYRHMHIFGREMSTGTYAYNNSSPVKKNKTVWTNHE